MLQKGRCLFRSLTTPDGTELISHHRHDYVEHTDKINGKNYMLDGGLDYCRSRGHGDCVYTELTDSDPFEVIREHFTRGSRGKNMNEELRWVKLSEMSDDHLEAVIIYCLEHRATHYLDIYEHEQEYRKEHNIVVPEKYEGDVETSNEGIA